MALPQFFRFVIVNATGQTITFNANGRILIKMWGLLIDPTTGLAVYTELTESEDDMGFIAGQSISNGSELVGDNEIDNTVLKYIGLQAQMKITHDEGALAEGAFNLHISVGDAVGDLQTDASGYAGVAQAGLLFVGPLIWPDSLSDDNVVLSNMITI